jgi:hypothetical protein
LWLKYQSSKFVNDVKAPSKSVVRTAGLAKLMSLTSSDAHYLLGSPFIKEKELYLHALFLLRTKEFVVAGASSVFVFLIFFFKRLLRNFEALAVLQSSLLDKQCATKLKTCEISS